MDLLAEYERRRTHHQHGWGLAWYLAAEFCQRFHASHGITPRTIIHEGLDPKSKQSEHPGWTSLWTEDKEVMLVNDGRVLKPAREASLWKRYMQGETEEMLLEWLEDALGLPTVFFGKGERKR